jgi:uncharacterized membrane protein
MAERKATVERLGAFSDAVFAVIITIMVLELNPPDRPTFAALLPLWPTALSYAVSYLFIAIIWMNHHHLLRFIDECTPRLIWINFAHLFTVSLMPFATAWVARTRLAAVPVFVYAAVFVLVELAYLQFEHQALAQAVIEGLSHRTRRLARMRSFAAFGLFLTAMFVSFKLPKWGFGLVCCAVLLYLQPELPKLRNEDTDAVTQQNGAPPQQEKNSTDLNKHLAQKLPETASKE